MLIDIHTHAGPTSDLVRALAGRGISTNSRPRMTAAQLVDRMDVLRIDRAVVLPLASPEAHVEYMTTEQILEGCRAFPERLIPFCSIDPRMVKNDPESDFGPILEFYREAGCRGVGEYIPNLPFDAPLNMNVFAHVEAAGLPLTFHIAPRLGGGYGCYDDPGLPRLERVLGAFPRLVFLGHSQAFWSEIDANVGPDERGGYPKGPVKPGRVVELMRRYPNLHGDLSAGSGFNAISRDPEFGLAFFEEFQDRLLFGTDLLWPDQDAPIVDYFRDLEENGRLSRDVLEKIMWRNADRLLGLGLEA